MRFTKKKKKKKVGEDWGEGGAESLQGALNHPSTEINI